MKSCGRARSPRNQRVGLELCSSQTLFNLNSVLKVFELTFLMPTSYPVELPQKANAKGLATLSRPHDSVWELKLHNGVPNTLTTEVIFDCITRALDIVEEDWRSSVTLQGNGDVIYKPGAFVITGSRGGKSKYFSRGALRKASPNSSLNLSSLAVSFSNQALHPRKS